MIVGDICATSRSLSFEKVEMASTGKCLQSSGALSSNKRRGSRISYSLSYRDEICWSLKRLWNLSSVLIAISCTEVSLAEQSCSAANIITFCLKKSPCSPLGTKSQSIIAVPHCNALPVSRDLNIVGAFEKSVSIISSNSVCIRS